MNNSTVNRWQSINQTFWVLLTIFTIIGMIFTYFILYLQEIKYLFPISASEYPAIRNMVEERTETKLPENSDILLAYNRLGLTSHNQDDISIVVRLPTASKDEYLVSANGISRKTVWNLGNNAVIKLSYTGESRDNLALYIYQNGKDRLDAVNPVYIPVCVLILLLYYIIYKRIKKHIQSAGDDGMTQERKISYKK